jgi:hypothetical protein
MRWFVNAEGTRYEVDFGRLLRHNESRIRHLITHKERFITNALP